MGHCFLFFQPKAGLFQVGTRSPYQFGLKQKSLHEGGFQRDLSFLFFAHKPPEFRC
ncbi:hypothetical protein Y888_20450 [Mixta calida B021323]|nr:hypothetical protein Y888_20450 [Mixta calida B021323]